MWTNLNFLLFFPFRPFSLTALKIIRKCTFSIQNCTCNSYCVNNHSLLSQLCCYHWYQILCKAMRQTVQNISKNKFYLTASECHPCSVDYIMVSIKTNTYLTIRACIKEWKYYWVLLGRGINIKMHTMHSEFTDITDTEIL